MNGYTKNGVKIGRPRVPDEYRGVRLQAMFTRDEAAELKRIAAERGISVSQVIHDAVLGVKP